MNRPAEIIQTYTRNSGADVLQEIFYTGACPSIRGGNAVGNITEIQDSAQQTFYYSNSVIAPRGKYWYDALYRLTKATGRELASLAIPSDTDFINNLAVPNTASNAMQNFTQEYSYDELGNIEQMKSVGDWTRDYYYETANNRLKNHDNQTDVYAYDEHGNCKEMPHLPELVWDYKDELKEVTLNASNHKAHYVYDASGERVRKVVDKGSVVEERLYLGGFEIYRKTVSGTLDYERETLKITEGRNTIAQLETKTIENGNTISTPTTNQRFQYSNHLGSACLELDSSANIISYEEYHPFGTTSYRSGSSETEVSLKRYKYVGKERDEETGLYYYGARYYATWTARFVSVDPLQFEYPHYTPYQYAGNKPITYIDLDGLEEYNSNNIGRQLGLMPDQIWNSAVDGFGNILLLGFEYCVQDSFEGKR
ncbi:MAG: RHS repeat-associated core domain-containing protein [Bacteroidales bacterium]|nr:RHS repeat-associated core domain-containing protein [Bacteroidales bacterium]MCF8459008.1 RHS repeat-associated core domain-containing protein [Bacteroidales bacterium]